MIPRKHSGQTAPTNQEKVRERRVRSAMLRDSLPRETAPSAATARETPHDFATRLAAQSSGQDMEVTSGATAGRS
jgi:hypothetical protein